MVNVPNGIIFLSPGTVLPPGKELTSPKRLDSTSTETPPERQAQRQAFVANTLGAVLGGTKPLRVGCSQSPEDKTK